MKWGDKSTVLKDLLGEFDACKVLSLAPDTEQLLKTTETQEYLSPLFWTSAGAERAADAVLKGTVCGM